MNPDVARFEARRRLAKVWTPAPSPMGVVHVPTIGMMLAEIRRRGWHTRQLERFDRENECMEIAWEIWTNPDYENPKWRIGVGVDEEHADALALALAEALEWEAGT